MDSRLVLVPLLALALVAAAGCGGTASPQVASLGTTAGTTTTSASPAPSGGPSTSSSSGGGGNAMVMKLANGAKYASCMRKNGVPNFPDPSSNGSIQFGPGSGIDPNSAKFRQAAAKCQGELEKGPPPSPAQAAKARQSALAFSACMRSHGIHDFPDPQFSGNRISIRIGGPGHSDIDPQSPRFQAAQSACQGLGLGPKGPVASKGVLAK